MDQNLYNYLLMLGDNSMILGHRLSELCGHGPSLETDIALTNISLDLFGQVRNIFQYAAKLNDQESSEDSIAFLRNERQHYNCILVEQPNTDFAHVILRQYLFDQFQLLQLNFLLQSKDEQLKAIAAKSIKETKYHIRFSSEWCKRLGQGTEISHNKITTALELLYPFCNEFFETTEVEKEMMERGIGPNLEELRVQYFDNVTTLLNEAGLSIPQTPFRVSGGKHGRHSEHLGYILAEFQYMQKTYPNMQW